MAVNRNAGAEHHLLGSYGEIAGPRGGTELDGDGAPITKVDETLTLGGAEHIAGPRAGLTSDGGLWQERVDSESSQGEEKGPALLLERIHANSQRMATA